MTQIDEMYSNGTIYVRHQIGDPIADVPTDRKGPFTEEVAEGLGVCVACRSYFEEGEYSVLIPLGPGDDTEAQEKAKAGQWYNAVAVAIHDTCSGGSFE